VLYSRFRSVMAFFRLTKRDLIGKSFVDTATGRRIEAGCPLSLRLSGHRDGGAGSEPAPTYVYRLGRAAGTLGGIRRGPCCRCCFSGRDTALSSPEEVVGAADSSVG
jgi:hypothetical protein